MLLKASEHL
jgi:hypothetical protein